MVLQKVNFICSKNFKNCFCFFINFVNSTDLA